MKIIFVSIKDFTNREGAPLGEGSDRSNDLLVEVRTAELRCSMLRCKLHPQKVTLVKTPLP